ncbi:two-component system sensor histidine kinase NtrB [Phreatobacter sp. AB_2022a]|uniref:two-component system sensor histidine kinase NtrB n=1 Tax=Phreatobacter sp. AB_2022a TaxID=3003134 RepID=UPI00228702FB|nr:ATP-binding protein [Phreatobacter sp. AB_2022a]MCZ0734614.1 ATP-binding protein [Phreatobacter sp. AB_2022a]
MRRSSIEQIKKASLTVSEARLSSVLDIAADGIVVVDESRTMLVFNKACETLFGWTAAEAIGRRVDLILGPVLQGAGDDADAGLAVEPIVGGGREVAGRHRDGTAFPVELSVAEAATPDGRQFIAILRDLRPRKEAEERLNQLQTDLLHMARVSAVDEMGAALAHELNQPLTAVMLYLQAVGRAHDKATDAHRRGEIGAHLDDTIRSILGKAQREAERAGNIIRRMRDFVEKREPERRLVDLNGLVEEAVELTLLGYRPGARVVRHLRSPLPAVRVDAVQIQQIVVNLMRNALEAVRGGGQERIWIETQAKDGTIRFSVRDSGPGVPPEAMPHLFRAFASTKRTGLGLGLAISRAIAQNHGGDLTVDPGGNGRGACFSLVLPEPADEDAGRDGMR